MMPRVMIKKGIAGLLVFVLLLTSLPLTAFAGTMTAVAEAEDEYIYNSDLFFGYPIYLTDTYNISLNLLENHRKETTYNIICKEYINTPNFYASVVSQGLSIATDPAGTVKYFTDCVGATNFQFNNELDVANLTFVKKLCETNLLLGEAGSVMKEHNNYVKKMNGFLKAIQAVTKAGLLDEAYYEDLDKPKVYSSMFEQSMAYYKDYFTQIDPSLSFETQLHTALSGMTSFLGGVSTAADFTQALIMALLMQDAQIELIQEIIDTQPTTSTLYKGLTRLKNQLKNGWMSYFIDTFVKERVYEQVVGKVTGQINKWIMGDWVSYYSAVTAVVKVVNTVVFGWILGADYGAYRSALMLDTYASDLRDSVANKALAFQAAGFTTKDIEQYELLFSAYIAMSKASLDACQDLAKYNPTYEKTYLKEQLKLYDNDNLYTDYLNGVKAYILAIPKENRKLTEYGTWTLSGDTVICRGADEIEDGYIYTVDGVFNGTIKTTGYGHNFSVAENKRITINGNLDLTSCNNHYGNEKELDRVISVPETSELTVNGNLYHNCYDASGAQTAAFYNYGKIVVNGSVSMSGSYSYYFGGSAYADFWNYGVFQVNGEMLLKETYGVFYNFGTVTVNKNIEVRDKGKLLNRGEIHAVSLILNSCYDGGTMQYSELEMDIPSAYIELTGDFLNNSSNTYSKITAGTIVFSGTEQQEVKNVKFLNVEVHNPKGIKYLSDIHLYGEYKLNGNPLDNNGHKTYIYDGCSFDPISDYKELYLDGGYDGANVNLTSSVTANITIDGYSSYSTACLTIPSGHKVTINGNVYLRDAVDSRFVNDGECEITGSLTVKGGTGYYGYVCIKNNGELSVRKNLIFEDASNGSAGEEMVNGSNSTLRIGGNFNAGHSDKLGGRVIFDGSAQQEVKNVKFLNVEVHNPKGIKYLSDIHLYGEYKLNGNPLDNNGHKTYIYDGCSFDPISDYKELYLDGGYDGANVNLTSSVTANITIDGYSSYSTACLTIPSGHKVTINGNVYLRDAVDSRFVNDGECEITGSLTVKGGTGYYRYVCITNNGELSVRQNLILEDASDGRAGDKLVNGSNSTLRIGGNFNAGGSDKLEGRVIFDGSNMQAVKRLSASVIELENESEEGVVFETKISPSVLFNHNGNKFTLKSGGTFVDYDGDGLKDDVDPEPTVGNPCTLYFKSEDAEKGTVSLGKVETVGGTEITVTATPTFKYYFVKWVNSSGATVSTSAAYTSVVTENETYTAIFAKRQQPITVKAEGGKIQAPKKAEIESKVTVTVSENDGYVYTDGSLSCNGIPVENGSFIMPDEAVVLTAEFVRNESYFSLNEALTAAMAYTYEAYSKDSFANLTSVINAAKTALVNNVTAEESENQIALLQSAIDGLEDKYIATVTLKTTPTLYIRVPDMIDHIPVLITYDNGTTITVTGADCMIEGYDAAILGKQSITVTYGGVSGTVNVNVEKRLLSDCTVSEIADLIYDGIKTEYTQTPVVVYSRTNEVMTEGVDFEVAYADNSTIGVAKIIVTGIGDYTGSRTITFNIYCAHNYVVTEQVDPTCTEDGYKIEKCTICGILYEEVITEGLPESDHNYGNNLDVSYYYTNAGASSLLLKFSDKTFTESGYDKIYIYDGSGTLIGTYTGNSLAGKTITASGDAVRIRLTTDGSVNKYGFSLDSITALFARRLLPKIEHIYGDWSVVTPATPNETGVKHRLCTACGAEETGEIPAVVGLSFKGASLSLHHNLAINYKVDKALFEEVGYTDPYVVFEIGGKKVTVRAYTVEGERYVFRFRNIAPNQMNDTIYATLYATYNGVKYASEVREYSVAEYCYTTLAKYSADAYAELRTLLVDLLHYGAQSQLYTKHQTDNLADANLTEQQLLWGTADDPTLTNSLNTAYRTVEDPLVTWKGASLKLNDSVLMRFKFIAEDIEDLSLKITGETGEWTLTSKDFVSENGVYFVYFSGLNAGQMSEKVYLTMYKNGVAVSNTVCYSIESYAYSKKDSTIQYLSDLVKAMMKYGNAARAYAN